MIFLVAVGITLLVGLVILALVPEEDEPPLGCDNDVPCQECGRCFDSHINALGVGHPYRYPRG